MNDSILLFLKNCFIRLYELGSTTYIYNDNGVQISLISFLLALAIMTIVLSALVNTVRYRVGTGIAETGHTIENHVNWKSKPSSESSDYGIRILAKRGYTNGWNPYRKL